MKTKTYNQQAGNGPSRCSSQGTKVYQGAWFWYHLLNKDFLENPKKSFSTKKLDPKALHWTQIM